MGAIVSGNVNIKIAIEGTGGGVAHTERATKAVEKLKNEVGAAGSQASTAAKQLGGIKDSIKPLDGARSTFENIRSNLLGFPLAIGAAVGGIIELAAKIADAGSASERLRERAQDYATAIAGAKKDLDELLKINGRFGAQSGGPLGADAGDRFADLVDKLGTLQAREREILALREKGFGFLLESKVVQTELTTIQHEIAGLDALRVRLQNESADAAERQLAALKKIVGLGLLGLGQGGGAGKVIDLDKIGGPTIIDRPSRSGGGGRGPRPATAADLIAGLSAGADRNARGFAEDSAREAERAYRERLAGYDAANDNGPLGRQGKGGKGAESGLRGIATDIRDVTAALSESLPGLDEFAGALGRVSEIWSKWGGAAGDTRKAVVGSLGEIAKAGAAQIKDERLRAGVLSIIELGLGFANLANPAVAAGHFTASAVLGSVAIFGSGSGSGSSRGGSAGGSSSQRPVRVTGETLGQSAVNVTINGNYYGGRSEQEAGADFSRLTRRTQGTGFERGRDAA